MENIVYSDIYGWVYLYVFIVGWRFRNCEW